MTMPAKEENLDALAAAASKWFEQLDDRGVFITDDCLIVRRWNRWLVGEFNAKRDSIAPIRQAPDHGNR